MKQKFLITIGVIVLLVTSYFYFYPKLTRPPKPTEHRDVIVTLERTPCFGTCPYYKLTIYGEGKVVYEGGEFVKVTGRQTTQISKDKVKEIVDEFYRVGYFSLRDEYTEDIADMSTTITSITIDGKTKKVVNYYGAPKKLAELENKIDAITNSKKWVGKCTFDTCEEKQSPTPAASKDNLVPLLFGTWKSIEDAKFTREFKADGTVIDYYQGDASATTRGTWSVADPSKEETGVPVEDLVGMTVIKLTFSNNGNYALYFTLDYLTETSLMMTYLARGNLQTYEKVK